jgi:hypothetical protein
MARQLRTMQGATDCPSRTVWMTKEIPAESDLLLAKVDYASPRSIAN